MIDKNLLDMAIEVEISEIKKDIERRGTGEIIYVPIRVETYGDSGRIGCIDHSNIMRIYNELVRGKVK